MGPREERRRTMETKTEWRRRESERAKRGDQPEGREEEGKGQNGDWEFHRKTLFDKSKYRSKKGILRR